jgi:uncharacterized protein
MIAPLTMGGRRRRRGRRGKLHTLLAAALALLALVIASPRALAAFTPPPLRGHVVDTAGKLTQGEVLQLDAKLDAIRRRTGFELVAFVVGSLEGETIEDVAYETFNTWRIGQERLDNGVLLVIAPSERRIRIETGKGVGGALTDLQSNDIIREAIAPLLQQDRFYEAIDRGTSAIADTLVKGTPEAGKRAPPGARAPDVVTVGIGAGVLVLVIVLAIVSPTFRSILWFFLHMLMLSGGRRGGGGGFGGSGYGGGGGRSGGGGSSDSY